MKVVLYMAITVNGYIARKNGETPWSAEEWNSFSEKVKLTKNIIIGRKTFDIMNKEKEFQKLGNPFIVAVSSKGNKNDNYEFVKSPRQALKLLRKKGFSQTIVAGGGILNSSFIKEGLVNEIILDVEPMIFGEGIKLFSGDKFETKLELLKTRQLSKNTIQLHYRIV